MNYKKFQWHIAQFFELLWWRFYFSGKNKKAYLEMKKKYWQSVFNKIEDIFLLNPAHRVLELGCGPAGCFIFFEKNHITAVDPLISSYQLRLPFFNPAEYENTDFICSSIEDVQLTDLYEVVLCFNAINHVSDLRLSLQKIRGWMNPGGVALISVDAHNSVYLKKIFSSIPGDVLHPHQYTLNEYIDLCREAGLKATKTVLLKEQKIFSHYLLVLTLS